MSPSNYWHARKLLSSRRSNKNTNFNKKKNSNYIVKNKNITNNNYSNNEIDCDNNNNDRKNHNNDNSQVQINSNNDYNNELLTSKSSFRINNDKDQEETAYKSITNLNDHVISIPPTHEGHSATHNNDDNDTKQTSHLQYQNEATRTGFEEAHNYCNDDDTIGEFVSIQHRQYGSGAIPYDVMMLQNHDHREQAIFNSQQHDVQVAHMQQHHQQHSQLDQQHHQIQEQQLIGSAGGGASAGANAVVGVGGTVTTVSRGHRKTAPLPRLVAKNGTVNLFLDNIDRRQYMRDLFTTMIDIKWRYNLAAAALGFVISWLFFAIIWYLVLYLHGDLEHENEPTWSPCIVNVNSFSSALLFSIETQSTLGFGSRIISVECPSAIVIFCAQLIFGVVIECLIVGMVFAKLSRPAKRSQTIMFSKMATVSLREGRLCLIFRVGDVRSKSHIIGATIRVSLVSHKVTLEGEVIPFYHHQLDAKIDGSRNNLLLIWPVLVVHEIDQTSPLFHLNAKQLAEFKFEIITVLEGTIESTGQSIQVRSSYLPGEVKWGYRFEQIVSTHGFGRYAQTIIDYNKFNKISELPDMPQCSSADYEVTKSLLNHVASAKGLALDSQTFSLEPNNNTTNYNRNHQA